MPTPNDSSKFEWEGTVNSQEFAGAFLEIAFLAFTSAAQLKAGKPSLTPREVAECAQQTVVWANLRLPSLNVRLRP